MKFYLKKVLRIDYHPKTDKEIDNIEKSHNIEVQKINENLNLFQKTDENLNSFEKNNEQPIKENNTDEISNKIIGEIDPN